MRSLPALFLACLSFSVTQSSTMVEVPVGIFDWQLYLDTTAWGRPGEALSVTINWALAAIHFNNRRTDIIPDLARLQNCNKKVKIVRLCETTGDPLISVTDVIDMLRVENPAILGAFAGTPEAVAASIAAAAWGNVPCISHWASGDQLTNRIESPTFVRTVTADGDIALTVVQFLVSMNYSMVGVVHLDIDSGPALAQSISDLMYTQYSGGSSRYSIQVQQFVELDQASMTLALKKLNDAQFNVIVFVLYADDMPLAAQGLKANNMLLDDKLFVVCFLDRQLTSEEVMADPVLADFANGVINIHNAVPYNATLFDHYVSIWPTFNATEVAPILPPYGFKNSTWTCRNQNIPILNPLSPMYNGTFFHDTQQYAYEVWGQAYDAMLAIGFAICASDPTGPTFKRGLDLYNDLVAVDFEGLTGHVEFDPTTGNRKLSSEPIRMRNWKVTPAGFTNDFVASFDAASNSWLYRNASSIVLRGNVTGLRNAPPDFTIPIHNHNYLPAALRALAYFEVAFLLTLSVASSTFLYVFRHSRAVLNSQPVLMHFIVLGCMVASFAILTLSIDDNPDNLLQNVAAGCASAPVLYELGIQLTYFAIIAKTWRIHVLFQSSVKLKRRSYTAARAVRMVALALLAEFTLLMTWVAVSPMEWVRVVQFQDNYGDVVQSYGWCAATELSGAIGITVFAVHGFSIILGAIAARGVRDIPVEFGESKFIAYSIAAKAQIFFLAVPTAVAVYSDVIGRFIILSSCVFCTVLVTFIFLIWPKVMVIYYKEVDIWKAASGSNTDAVTARKAQVVSTGANHTSMVASTSPRVSTPQRGAGGKKRDGSGASTTGDILVAAPVSGDNVADA